MICLCIIIPFCIFSCSNDSNENNNSFSCSNDSNENNNSAELLIGKWRSVSFHYIEKTAGIISDEYNLSTNNFGIILEQNCYKTLENKNGQWEEKDKGVWKYENGCIYSYDTNTKIEKKTSILNLISSKLVIEYNEKKQINGTEIETITTVTFSRWEEFINTKQQLQRIARYGGDIYDSFFSTPDGLKLVPTDMSKMPTNAGLYSIYFEYNTEESAGQKEINITLLADPVLIPPKEATPSTSSTIKTPNAAMAMLEYVTDYSRFTPVFYDKSTMLFPMLFWSISVLSEEEWKKELAKHEFEVTYDFDEANEPNTLILTLKHQVRDTEEDKKPQRTRLIVTQYALDVSEAISKAMGKCNNNLTRIKVAGKCNNSDKLEHATDVYIYVDCSKINFD